MYDNKVWNIVPLPEGVKPISCKWIFKTKKNSEGNVERYKARLVAKGFTQKECIDSKQMVYKLKKSIYELKQASRQWYFKFHQVIISFGFKPNLVDECIYHKFNGSKFVFLVLYVDDILLASNDKNMMYETKIFLFKHFDMKDLSEASYVLDLKIHRDRNKGILGLSQQAYIDKVLKRYGMKNYKPGNTPVAKGDKFSLDQCPKTELEKSEMHQIPY
jgi:Reverse transcriptase (RNA-dependent DNA polymerase)